ncbi:MAG: hypothetical protein P8X89_22620 [Reinekea sp.]
MGNIYRSQLTGGYRLEQGQCIFAVRNGDDSISEDIAIYIYANHFPDLIIEDQFKESSQEFTDLLNYPEEIDLPMDVCDEFCEYNEETGACFYKSPNLKITGKIFDLEKGVNYYLYMKLKGVRY